MITQTPKIRQFTSIATVALGPDAVTARGKAVEVEIHKNIFFIEEVGGLIVYTQSNAKHSTLHRDPILAFHVLEGIAAES